MWTTSDTAAGRTYRQVRDEIVSGALRPGAVLAEVEQSERLGVSRTPLREALRQLAADGLLERSGRGLVVTGLTDADVRGVFELRAVLDATGARWAAERGDRALFADLARRFDAAHAELSRSADPGTVQRYYALASELDAAVDAAAANPYLMDAQTALRMHAARMRRLSGDRPDRLLASALEHRLIAHAIAAGDAALAEHATHVHLHHTRERVLEALAASGHPVGGPAS